MLKRIGGIAERIICIGAVLFMTVVTTACGAPPRTESEHLQEINKIVQAFYIEHRGMGATIHPKFRNFTSFESQILYAFDGTPEYFLIEYEPDGCMFGIISENKYYFLGLSSYGENEELIPSPYVRKNVDKTNRYFAFVDKGKKDSEGKSLYVDAYAAKENGVLINILTGETYDEQELKAISDKSRERLLRHAAQLKYE